MGNSTGLAYDVEESIEYRNGAANWQMHRAVKQSEKDDLRETVSIFRIAKAKATENQTVLAQRNVQKLKTLRHPNVLSFIESADLDDSIALVTESCVPCEVWLKRSEFIEEEDQTELAQELIWGFKCIVQALQFLHDNGSLLHGNLGLNSIFVTPGGDWKLGAFELAGNLSNSNDFDTFLKNHTSLEREYFSPERQRIVDQNGAGDSRSLLTAKVPPFYLDMYSLGRCIQKAFQLAKIEQPKFMSKYMLSLLHDDYKKRPTAQKLHQSAMFNSEHIRFLESIGELVLQSPKEFIESICKMDQKIIGLSKSVCAHKILPNLSRAMQMAINDFPQRDSRESCRQLVQISVTTLCKLSATKKIDEKVFQRLCIPILINLWAMTDRTIRTCMLNSLKDMAILLPSAVINKNVFDNVLAGFSDSNSKLRESTLMSLIFIVEKLEESQLQDRLVRVVCNLQNDVEASIRTNATIFIGKISIKMKEGIRTRVLCNALLKAMKDNFVHCRVAGLKTASACLKMIDIGQIATKLLPQASVLSLDKSSDVRSLSLSLIESCLKALRAYNANVHLKVEEERRLKEEDQSKSTSIRAQASESNSGLIAGTSKAYYGELPQSGKQSQQSESSWSSWSMLQGLSKTLENATISVATPVSSNTSVDLTPSTNPISPSGLQMDDGYDANPDDSNGESSKIVKAATGEQVPEEFSVNVAGQGWDADELDDLNLDDEVIDSPQKKEEIFDAYKPTKLHELSPAVPKVISRAAVDGSTASPGGVTPLGKVVNGKATKAKPVVKKLATSSQGDDNWDDF